MKEPDRKTLRKKMRAEMTKTFALGEASDVDALIALLRSPVEMPDMAIRFVALLELGKLQATNAIPHIIPLLGDPRSDVRCGAAVALGRLGGRDALPQLFDLLRDEHAGARQRAVESIRVLGEGDAAAVGALARALDDENWDVRRAALEALAVLGDESLLPILESRAKLEPLWRRRHFQKAARAVTAKVP